jgi:hypothetical protein
MSRFVAQFTLLVLLASLLLTLYALTSCDIDVLRVAMTAMLIVEVGLASLFGWVLTHWR